MSGIVGSGPRPAPRIVVVAALLLTGVVTWWLMNHAFISANARECHRRYAAAQTAADTAVVDRFVPDPDAGTSTASASCGGMRGNARW